MIERFKGKANLARFFLLLVAALGIYLTVAWASYSPLDSGWTVASSVTNDTLNKAGSLGAWVMDLLFASLGRAAFVVPFALVCVPLYLLVTRQCEGLDCRQVSGWTASFAVLLVGLAGLASVLFSNTAAYLSGGFLGAIQGELIGEHFGLFGTLFIAMMLTAVGFYFCSGQIIWHLFNRLYQWIVEDKEEKAEKNQHDSEPQGGSSAENFANDAAEMPFADAETQTENSPTFTDVSQFTRPKITGLREPVAEPPKPTETAEPSFTDLSQFKAATANDVSLPKISVPDQPNAPTVPTATDVSLEPEPVFEPTHHFPTVRLNPTVAEESRSESVNVQTADDLQKNAPISPVVEPEAVSVPKVAIAPDVDTQDENENVVSFAPEVNAPQPEFLKPTVKITPPEPIEAEAKPDQPNYPKSYGNSLVHPLLQTAKKLDKPTTPMPTLDLLEENAQATQQITEQQIRETSARIEQELANFGVKATVEDVLVGPVVTRYEIKPAAGVKASKITNLDSDLARALIFKAIRITDVVPGKPFMGIETPNPQRETVWLRDVLDSDAFRHSKAILPMALGKDISGEPVVVDMAKMPHLLVAGQTGGGKSVGVNTMILSLLYKLTPDQLRFIMIDPKVVELSVYNDIPHLLTPVVTDMKKAENALRWAVEEMERRYLLVSSLGVRNIEGFNGKIDQAAAMNFPIPNPLWRPGDSMDALPPPLEKLPYIVLIVDEFADLMMSAGKQVEDHIMRIAQKARAVGIHLILATQRPSTDVITGVIKANIPSRIAFTVASQIDSRTILDKGGAESLLGRGDMLYSGAGSPEIIRVHGAFMSDDDVVRVADNWRARGKPHYIDSIVESSAEGDVDGGERGVGGDLDPLFDEIAQYMIESNVTSISGIQRRFSLGFNRAARIIDQLEEQGIISVPDSRGKREVLSR